MTALLARPAPGRTAAVGSNRALSNFTPNWFATVMGTAIIAVAASSLPVHVTGLHTFGVGVWMLAVALLVAVSAATVLHWIAHPALARTHHRHPVMAHFYGAPPMALLSVGAATLLLGRDVIGVGPALAVDWVLWFAGTLGGLVCAVVVPYFAFVRGTETTEPPAAFGGWLMPVVPPMVSASTGALLVPHTPVGQVRETLVVACLAMFGLSLLASVVIIALVWLRLMTNGAGEARTVPTLWIVLGPLGQSITAANLLSGVAGAALPAAYAGPLHAFGVLYGVPVWGFALLWASIAIAVTVRTARRGLPFSLTWWSFTFPVGTCVTGTSGLAHATGSVLFRDAAVLFYVCLLVAWVVVAARTLGGLRRGTLLAGAPLADAPRRGASVA